MKCIEVNVNGNRGILIPTLLCFLAASSAMAQAPCSGVQFGAFGKGVNYVVAQREGFYAQEGVTMCYNQVRGSVQQFDDLFAGNYDVISTAADNPVNRVANLNMPMVLFAGLDKGPGLALAVSVANGIRTFADLKGKAIAVDAPDSGFVFALRRILKANGLIYENGDYTFQVIGGTDQRYQALVAGTVTLAGDTQPQKVYATLVNPPYTGQIAARTDLKIMGLLSDYVAPYQSGSLATTPAYAAKNPKVLIALIRATVRSAYYIRDPANRTRVIADVAAELGLSMADAKQSVDVTLDPATGDIPLALVSRQGLLNAIALRAEFGGFTGNRTAQDLASLALPLQGLYDDTYWLAAMDSLFDQ